MIVLKIIFWMFMVITGFVVAYLIVSYLIYLKQKIIFSFHAFQIRRMAKKEKDPETKKLLNDVADHLKHIPDRKNDNDYE